MKLAFPVLALFLFGACGAGAASTAAGTYTVDTTALMASIPAAVQEAAKKAGEDLGKKMAEMFTGTVELKADGTAIMKGKFGDAVQDATGTWKLDGDKITITSKDPKDKPMTGKYASGTITIDTPDAGPGPRPKQLILRKK